MTAASAQRWVGVLTVIVAVFLGSMYYLDTHAKRTFKGVDLHQIAKNALNETSIEAKFNHMKAALVAKYGTDLIQPDCEWLFINAGGFMGQVCIMHASLSEYILLFGTSMGTDGHSGRYWAEIADYLVSGEFWQQPEHHFKHNVYLPGDGPVHLRWEATHVKFFPDTWMLEYGSGAIPSTMVFALADSVFSSTDFITIAKYFRIYGEKIIRSLLVGKV